MRRILLTINMIFLFQGAGAQTSIEALREQIVKPNRRQRKHRELLNKTRNEQKASQTH